ncbi:DUF3298 domain-containing protein [Oceanobacillus sp. Castelsardo]|uniref:DUF3298 domain-containing protein n=1 Tax=Oceanobacillus sp. Castelsardo TaxID=1851204 RepID=UPI00083977B6|nr:DUF3298 domain-containing protein [Oceanobacillus sp. Castelsardo]
MKFLAPILSLAFILLLISGCNSNETPTNAEVDENKVEAEEEIKVENEEEVEEDLVSKLKNYETIVLEDLKESHDITIEYPKFGFAPLDEIISVRNEEDFKGQQEQAESYRQDGFTDSYSYNITFAEPIITENIVSIYFDGRFYHGGGFPLSYTINFDLKNERLITLDDVLEEHSTSLEVIADLLAQKLINDERFAQYRDEPVTERYKDAVEKETTPDEKYYSSFTLTDDSITFYKQYPSIMPNAEGIVGIELTWDEVESYMRTAEDDYQKAGTVTYEFGDSVEPASTLQYTDEDYGFSLTFPESWKDSYLVHETSITEYHFAPVEPSKVLAVSMVEDGKYIGDVFFIDVLEGVSEQEAKAFYKQGEGFQDFVAEGNGVSLAYGMIGEMPLPLYEEPYLETGNQYAKMAQDDRVTILETVKFK